MGKCRRLLPAGVFTAAGVKGPGVFYCRDDDDGD
jgi:hypothetical protein